MSELANDYLNWLLRQESLPWSVNSQEYQTVSRIVLDRPTYKDDVQYQSSMRILAQKHKFDQWLKCDNSLVVANCLLVLCNRLILMISRQEQSVQADAPTCPLCDKPMIKRVAKKGVNSGILVLFILSARTSC